MPVHPLGFLGATVLVISQRVTDMRILIAALAAVVLAGCVSSGNLERNDPSIKTSTSKGPKMYVLCVFPKWQNARSDASISETDSGASIACREQRRG